MLLARVEFVFADNLDYSTCFGSSSDSSFVSVSSDLSTTAASYLLSEGASSSEEPKIDPNIPPTAFLSFSSLLESNCPSIISLYFGASVSFSSVAVAFSD